jgi:hypothetical protein
MNSISRMPPGPSLTFPAMSLRHFAAYLRMQLAHGIDRAEIEILAEYEGTAQVPPASSAASQTAIERGVCTIGPACAASGGRALIQA